MGAVLRVWERLERLLRLPRRIVVRGGIIVGLLLIGLVLAVAAPRSRRTPVFRPAAPSRGPFAALRSSELELRVFARPYRYELIDLKTGRLLLAQRRTECGFGGRMYPAQTASGIERLSHALRATIRLRGCARSLSASFRFVSPGVLQVYLTPDGAGATDVAEAFRDQGERCYGLWEYPFQSGLDNRGVDEALLSPGYRSDAHHASARAPFYVTSAGYGVYTQSDTAARYRLAVDGETGFRFHSAGLTYYVLYGPSYARIMQSYRNLAGPARVPPTWALGTMWWRDNAHKGLRPGVRNAQENVLDDARQLQERRIPASAIWIDRPYGTGANGWGHFDFDDSFPHPKQMVRELDRRGLRLMLWMANRFWKVPKPKRRRLYLKGPKGGVLDLRRPHARRYLQHGLRRFAALGVSGYKVDRGEEGELADDVQNEMATHVVRAAYESFPADRRDQAFLIARNVYDTGRQYSAVWNGDVISSFSGLRMSVKNAVRSGILGFPAWGSDTGGLLSPWAKTFKVHPDRELLARWLEFSAYSPIMQVLIGPERTPWLDYDTELVEIARTCAATHHDLIPFTRSCLYAAARTGMPVVQPLLFSYPDDPAVADRWDEYLYGGQLLVAPVLNSMSGGILGSHVEFSPGYIPHLSVQSNERELYVPAGRWLDYNDRRTVVKGPRTLRVRPPLNTIPVYVREGAIIPRGDVLRGNNNWSGTWRPRLRIEVFPAAKADSAFAYVPGEEAGPDRSPRMLRSLHRDDGLEVHCDDLGSPGEFEVYCRRPTAVVRNGRPLSDREYRFDAEKQVLRVSCSGATRLSLIGAASVFSATPSSASLARTRE